MKHMKRITAVGLSLALALSLAACGAKNDPPAPEANGTQEEQGITDYTGEYADRVSQRATMSVAQDGEELRFEITWGSSAFETSVWTMSGKLSEDGKFVDYNDARLVTTTYGEPGEAPEESAVPVEELVVYEHGTGYFEITDGVFKWVSDSDEFAQAPEFERLPE